MVKESNALKFWDKDNKKIDQCFMIPATEEIDGKMYAKITLSSSYSKIKDRMALLLGLGETKKEIFIGSSTKLLGRLYAFPPAERDEVSEVKKTVL